MLILISPSPTGRRASEAPSLACRVRSIGGEKREDMDMPNIGTIVVSVDEWLAYETLKKKFMFRIPLGHSFFLRLIYSLVFRDLIPDCLVQSYQLACSGTIHCVSIRFPIFKLLYTFFHPLTAQLCAPAGSSSTFNLQLWVFSLSIHAIS